MKMNNPCTTNQSDVAALSTAFNEQINILSRAEHDNENQATLQINKDNLMNEWLSNIDDMNSEISSNNDKSSTVYSSSIAEDDEEFDQKLSTCVENKQLITNNVNLLQTIFNSTNNTKAVENITVENSKNIHIGNITYITGPINITQNDSENIIANKTLEKKSITKIEIQERNSDSSFIGNIKRQFSSNVLTMVDRRTWLAQKPFEPYTYLNEPAEFVIICHTATEIGTTQAENIYLVRNIQCFHIESRRWNDIAYNFLIGCDGNVYEGRGWGVVGAHTYGYNTKSLGISFLGCFMRELPVEISLDACKNLIKKGIDLGHISTNYKLLAQCQCRPFESPGKMLFDELKTWPNFCSDVSILV